MEDVGGEGRGEKISIPSIAQRNKVTKGEPKNMRTMEEETIKTWSAGFLRLVFFRTSPPCFLFSTFSRKGLPIKGFRRGDRSVQTSFDARE